MEERASRGRRANAIAAAAFLPIAFALFACSEKPQSSAQAEKIAPPPAPPVAVKKAEAPPAPPPNPIAEADKTLAAAVRKKLSEDPVLKSLALDVTASNGVVTLIGTADTKAHRDRAGRLAAAVQGVKSVDNKLVIVSGS